METFGEWLQQQRGLRRLTREEFAKRVGCSVSALQKIEYGERRPSAQIAELMANGLDVPLEERSTFVRVARGELGVDRLLPESKPITTNVSPPGTNLPVFPTPLIGRERDLEHLNQLLGDPQCRLLTLVGPGGIGKTRLAIETASIMHASFTDGVYFVPFDSANSARFIVPVIADVIGFAFQSANADDPRTQLFGYLKNKQALLLTDNLEQLLSEPGIELLAELLAHAPQVKLLGTSREPLGLQHEWVFEVQGLPVPQGIYTEESAQNTSVELFLQRARRAHVTYDFTQQDYPSILRICQMVDGMPLAIELAAAWVRTLSCDDIAQEIKRGLDILSISARDTPARHRSMRAVFDHSWKLLADEERRVLMRLSAFRGGFTREAAEQVAEAKLPVLSALIAKSLIRRSGAGRYDLHELIQQFAAEHLAGHPDEQSATQARHGKYFLTYFSQADGHLRSSAQRETLIELTAEMENFRAAWAWAVTLGEFALIEQTMRTFFRLYDTRGWFQEGLDTLDRAVNALEMDHRHSPPDRMDQVTLGHLLGTRSWFAYRLGNYEQAQTMLERSLEILRPLNEPHVLIESITYLGRVMEMTGNYARALELYSEGLETATAIGDRWFKAVCLTLHTALNGIILGRVKPEITHERLQSVVADWRLIGDPRLIAFGLDFLSRSALKLKRYDEAHAALEENIALNSSIGFDWGLGAAYRALGIAEQAQGKHQQAVDTFRKSLDGFTELGARQDMARVLAEMSRSVFALGDDAGAGHGWREALSIATETQSMSIAMEALVGIASLQAKQGSNKAALTTIEHAMQHPACSQGARDRAEKLREQIVAQLTARQIKDGMAQAHAEPFDVYVGRLLDTNRIEGMTQSVASPKSDGRH